MRPVATATAARPAALSRAARATLEQLEGRQLFAFGVADIDYLDTNGPTVATGASPGQIVQADFNGDGQLDIATLNDAGVTVALKGGGTYAPLAEVPVTGTLQGLRAADLNQDGKADLVVKRRTAPSTYAHAILQGNGDGTFAPAADVTWSADYWPETNFGLADVNGDGKVDIVSGNDTTTGGDVLIRYNTTATAGGAVTFAAAVATVTDAAVRGEVLPADVNGDGRPDLIAVGGGSQASGAVVLLNTGNDPQTGRATFGPKATYATTFSNPSFLRVADLTGDGKPDFTIEYLGGDFDAFVNNGDGTFTGKGKQDQREDNDLFADVNNDGKVDAVAAYSLLSTRELSVALGNGDGTFGEPKHLEVANVTFSGVAVTDTNGDGRADLLISDAAGNRVVTFLGKSAGGNNNNGGGGGNNNGGGTPTGSVDLAAQSISGLKSKLKAGDKAKANVRFNNDGDKALNGKVTVELYASTDTTLDGADRRLGRLTKSLKVAAKKGASLAVNFKMPKLADGAYNILAKVIGSGDAAATNDVVVMSNQLTVATPKIDLAAALASVPSLKAGGTAKAAVKISNVGGLPAKGTANVKYYVSTDGTLNGAVEVGKVAQKLNLKGGKSANASVNLNVPADLAGQQRFLVAVVTFGKDANAANNTVVSVAPVAIA